MSIEPFIGLLVAGALVPIIKRMTSAMRRFVRHRLNDGPLRRILLTPIGYTRKDRDEAAARAVMDDYHLLIPHQLGERNRAETTTLPAERL
jgi:hypothetical protein